MGGWIRVSQFLKHVKGSHGIVANIAKTMGVTREGLTLWLTRNPTMWEYIYAERENIVDLAETGLVNQIKKEEGWAIKFALVNYNRGRKRGYSEKDVVVNAEVNTGPTYKFIIEKPDDERITLETKSEAETSV